MSSKNKNVFTKKNVYMIKLNKIFIRFGRILIFFSCIDIFFTQNKVLPNKKKFISRVKIWPVRDIISRSLLTIVLVPNKLFFFQGKINLMEKEIHNPVFSMKNCKIYKLFFMKQ